MDGDVGVEENGALARPGLAADLLLGARCVPAAAHIHSIQEVGAAQGGQRLLGAAVDRDQGADHLGCRVDGGDEARKAGDGVVAASASAAAGGGDEQRH